MDYPGSAEKLEELEGKINDSLRALSNGFQKLEKIKDANRQNRQLQELTEQMKECKGLIKELEAEMKSEYGNNATANKMLNERKNEMIKELNSFVNLKKQYTKCIEQNKIDVFNGANEVLDQENVLLASNMTHKQLMDHGHQMMDETDQAIERGKKIVQETLNVGTDTAAALKAQTEQMSRIVNELDSIHFSIKKASQLVKDLGRQVATDKCILTMLFLIVMGIVAIIIVKLVNPQNKDIPDIPGLAPPVLNRRLLSTI